MPYSVGVFDQSPIYRSGLRKVLIDHGLRVSELEMPPSDGTESSVDALVIGIQANGERAWIRAAKSALSDTPIIVIVPPSENRFHAAVLTDGAMAAIPRDVPQATVAAAVQTVIEGWGIVVLEDKDVCSFRRLFAETLHDKPGKLDRNDLLILQRLIEGSTRHMLADDLHCAVRTVDRRIERLYRKLGATCQTDAIVTALLWGYLDTGFLSE